MNEWNGIGRITKDVEVKYSQGVDPKAVARFSVAISRRGKNGNSETDFIPIVAFGKTAENIEKYTRKGHKIGITGGIQSYNFKDKDGNNRSGYSVVASRVEFLEPKSEPTRSTTRVEYEDMPDFEALPDDVPF